MAEHLQRAEPDLLRGMLSTFVLALMSAEADAICGAGYGERSPERTNSRNGYRIRDFDTGPALWPLRSRSCGRGPTSPTGCSSGVGVPSGR
jgi:transposase-like protein